MRKDRVMVEVGPASPVQKSLCNDYMYYTSFQCHRRMYRAHVF
jgi:hypothetical protein